jgi:hypothetical protein
LSWDTYSARKWKMSWRRSWLLLVISLSTCKYCFIEILSFCVVLFYSLGPHPMFQLYLFGLKYQLCLVMANLIIVTILCCIYSILSFHHVKGLILCFYCCLTYILNHYLQ